MTSAQPGASAADDARVTRFDVTADLCPQVLLRILGLVAQHSLVPLGVSVRRRMDRLDASIRVTGLSPHAADVLLAKIAAIVAVREARSDARPRA